MAQILTVTMNPTIDVSTTVDHVTPGKKLRCGPERRDPGGGGINVARVVNRLGSVATALYPAGGGSGIMLRQLVERENIRSIVISIEGDTREDFTVLETASGEEYRFISIGPELKENEWGACLDMIAGYRDPMDFLVISGSLAPGAPIDFYARLAQIGRERGVPVALDTSGPALRAAIEHGVDLLKPSLREMRELTGKPLADPNACIAVCRDLIEAGKSKAVALTLGAQGAVYATAKGVWRAWPLPIQAVSTVGAGDSFLAALICGHACGLSPRDAFRQGVAGGSAALLAQGTQLCHIEDMQELLTHVVVDEVR